MMSSLEMTQQLHNPCFKGGSNDRCKALFAVRAERVKNTFYPHSSRNYTHIGFVCTMSLYTEKKERKQNQKIYI